MKATFLRRIILLLTVLIALWAVLIVPPLIAPNSVLPEYSKFLPSRVVNKIYGFVSGGPGSEWQERAGRIDAKIYPKDVTEDEKLGVEAFDDIVFRFTGVWPRRRLTVRAAGKQPGSLDSIAVLLILAPTTEETMDDGIVLIRNSRTNMSEVVAIGDKVHGLVPEAEVVKMDPYRVWFNVQGVETLLWRERISPDERREAESM